MSAQLQQRCPMCERDNGCRMAAGDLYKGACWCQQIVVPQPVLARLAESFAEQACLCRPCLEMVARLYQESSDIDAVLGEVRAQVAARRIAEEADFYLDEFGNTVFTASYHLKRGNCCGNQCRHCPY